MERTEQAKNKDEIWQKYSKQARKIESFIEWVKKQRSYKARLIIELNEMIDNLREEAKYDISIIEDTK
jgi:hypothetical protein